MQKIIEKIRFYFNLPLIHSKLKYLEDFNHGKWLLIQDLEKENEQIRKENEELRKKLSKIDLPVAGFDSTDDEPVDPGKRREYVIEVDNFYEFALKNKLKTSIADIREMLSNINVAKGMPQNMQRNEYDYFLRGMEAMAWKMDEWAITCQGERRENLQDKENS